MPPYIEVAGAVYRVIGWEPDLPLPEQIELRRLSSDETARYRRLRREGEIELWANMKGGER